MLCPFITVRLTDIIGGHNNLYHGASSPWRAGLRRAQSSRTPALAQRKTIAQAKLYEEASLTRLFDSTFGRSVRVRTRHGLEARGTAEMPTKLLRNLLLPHHRLKPAGFDLQAVGGFPD